MVGIFVFWGGEPALRQLILSIYASLTNFILVPVPMFFLMGEIMFQSGVAMDVINALDKWLGRLPGRLSLLTVASSTVLSALTGVPMASVALLGTTLAPEMEKRGYKKSMSLGSILGSSTLAFIIPPSIMGVLLAFLAKISVAKLLLKIPWPAVLEPAFVASFRLSMVINVSVWKDLFLMSTI